MAFKEKNMSVICFANGFTLWHYKTMDSIELLDEDTHYFSQYSYLMKTGDIIMINAGETTAMRCVINLKDDIVQLGRMS